MSADLSQHTQIDARMLRLYPKKDKQFLLTCYTSPYTRIVDGSDEAGLMWTQEKPTTQSNRYSDSKT